MNGERVSCPRIEGGKNVSTTAKNELGPGPRPGRPLGALGGGARHVPAHVRFDHLRLGDDRRGPLLPGRGLGRLAAAQDGGRDGRDRRGLQARRRPASRPARPPRRDRQPHLRHRHGRRGLRAHRERHQQAARREAPRAGGHGRPERPRGGQPLPPGQIRDGRRAVRHGHGLPARPLLRADRRRTVVPDGPARARRRGRSWPPSKARPGACAGPPPSPSPCRSAPWSSSGFSDRVAGDPHGQETNRQSPRRRQPQGLHEGHRQRRPRYGRAGSAPRPDDRDQEGPRAGLRTQDDRAHRQR